MSATLENLEHALHQTHVWIKEFDVALGWNDRRRSYRLLRNFLQAMRDALPLGEAAELAAQLPVLLRGVYYEGWRPTAKVARNAALGHFVERLRKDLDRDADFDAAAVAPAAFEFLMTKVSAGELLDTLSALRKEIRQLLFNELPAG